MSLLRKFLGILICTLWVGPLCLWAQAAQAPQQGEGSEIVAEIGGKKITRAEFEQKESANLLTARYKLYLTERQTLDEFVDDELLKQEAEREHITVDELLNRHVKSAIVEPTEDQLRVYYEGMQTDQPYEAVRSDILGTLRQIRTTNARKAYLKTLRQQDSATIMLAPPRANVELGDAPVRGPRNAPVTIIEFADYQCPYCQKVHPELKQLQQEFPGKVAIAFKDFPLSIHDHAAKAAEASRCAREQGKYWEYHDMLFEGKGLDKDQLQQYARNLNLDTTSFESCLNSGKEAAGIEKDMAEGKLLGIVQTPGFTINGHFLLGAVPYSTLHDLVQQQLAAAAQKSADNNTRAAR